MKIAIIPAKSWSRELPDKNIKNLCGKPMMAWTIEASIASGIDRTIVITDSSHYSTIAMKYGAEVVSEPPSKNRKGEHVIYALLPIIEKHLSINDTVVLLQPTSPLRTKRHINEALSLYQLLDGNNVISVTKSKDLGSIRKCNNGILEPLTDDNPNFVRQGRTNYYEVNGAIYISNAFKIKEEETFHTQDAVPYYMRAMYSIDVNTYEDFRIIEYLMRGENE